MTDPTADLAGIRKEAGNVPAHRRSEFLDRADRLEAELARLRHYTTLGESLDYVVWRERAEAAERDVRQLRWALEGTERALAERMTKESGRALIEEANRWQKAYCEALDQLANTREALAFYADEDKYLWHGDKRGIIQKEDRGEVARRALAAPQASAPAVAATPTQGGASPEGNDGEAGAEVAPQEPLMYEGDLPTMDAPQEPPS